MDDVLRLWFVSDIHASNTCFRKFLNFAKNEARPNVLIIGGDITGKSVVPVIDEGKGIFTVHRSTGPERISPRGISVLSKELEDLGSYVYECNAAQYKQYLLSKGQREHVYELLARQRLEEWVALADERLAGLQCKVFINAGNDDPLWVDEILDTSKAMTRPEGKIIDLPGGMKLLSTGYSNDSPWPCPRDETEEALLERILAMTGRLGPADAARTIFNLHCPPVGTHLDLAPALENDHRKKAGLQGAVMKHVGSESVRRVIEDFQPAVGLHGHIHTSAGVDWVGRTKCFNPGSDFASGTLQGAFLVFNSEGELVFDQLTNERMSLTRDVRPTNWLETTMGAVLNPFKHMSDRIEKSRLNADKTTR